MIDLGDPYVGAVTITDSDGNPANAGAVTCTITKPDGTTTDGTVSNPSTGTYRVTYTPTVAGRFSVYWLATGANASAYEDVFDVRDATSRNLLSLDDAKAALNIPASDTSQDEELRGYIEAATDIIESRIGPVVPRTVTETLSGRDTFVLSQTPVIEVTGINGVLTGAVAYDPAGLSADPITGVLRRLDRGTFGGDLYLITYTAGRDGVIPARILQAARVLLQHLWRTQRGVGGRGRGDSGTDDLTLGYSLPNRVVELLAQDLATSGIA